MEQRATPGRARSAIALLAVLLPAAACGTSPDIADGPGAVSTFAVEVWADNWMAVYVNGELVGEDPVSIATERSFISETFTFEATYPFTVGIEAKDFKETDSGMSTSVKGISRWGTAA